MNPASPFTTSTDDGRFANGLAAEYFNNQATREIPMTPIPADAPATQAINEAAGMSRVEVEIEELRLKYPEWYALYDDAGPDFFVTRGEMAELMAAAPTPFALGLMYGKFCMRVEIAPNTGIAFV
ncbi:MAG: hypothetical protein EPN79_11035 [Burkholderiaceae bacterium]|nr:MAG: hypothetical protein EPN79_11035 [Burkholderiaceae bacterium]TBR76782.1 MAG: hypothetical protein EPN64_06040 [Burkholderiaceae bacterium]